MKNSIRYASSLRVPILFSLLIGIVSCQKEIKNEARPQEELQSTAQCYPAYWEIITNSPFIRMIISVWHPEPIIPLMKWRLISADQECMEEFIIHIHAWREESKEKELRKTS